MAAAGRTPGRRRGDEARCEGRAHAPRRVQAARERLIGELQTALADVKTLSGLLPICGWCRKVRDDSGSWNSLEAYLKKTSGRDVTHGICPECNTRMLHELDQLVPEDFAPPPRPAR